MRVVFLVLWLLALAACEWKSADQHIAAAKDHIENADYYSASIELKSALQLDDNSAEARWLLGKVLLKLGDFAVQIIDFGFMLLNIFLYFLSPVA